MEGYVNNDCISGCRFPGDMLNRTLTLFKHGL